MCSDHAAIDQHLVLLLPLQLSLYTGVINMWPVHAYSALAYQVSAKCYKYNQVGIAALALQLPWRMWCYCRFVNQDIHRKLQCFGGMFHRSEHPWASVSVVSVCRLVPLW